MARASRNTRGASDGSSKARGRRPGLRRFIALTAFLPLAGRAPLYVRLLTSLVIDARTPASRKALLAGALGYVAVGRDLIPDYIPVLGQLDDVLVVALATELFLDGIDEALLSEKLAEAGIPRAAYEEDVARIRRLLPGPLRRTVRRIPAAIRTMAEAYSRSGIDSRVRAWIDRDRSASAPAA